MTRPSPESRVREFYDATAESYAAMMDSEIGHPMYADVLGRLAERTASLPGPVVDTSCGSGHMLSRYRELYDPDRPVVGVDLSPAMVSVAKIRLDSDAEILTGDMRDLGNIESGSAAALLSFFALHHLDSAEILSALQEWRRVLRPGGQLAIAAWEGAGAIDYGEASDMVALRYGERQLREWAQAAGFVVDRCVVEPVEGMPMDAVYLEGTRDE